MNEILQGKICPYCNQKSELVHSSIIYGAGTNYGMIYLCKSCDAYVGCHKGTEKALGSLANRELRALRNKCHALFDVKWKGGDRISRQIARNSAYQWLSKQLEISREVTHIAMFDEQQCKHVIELLQK
ncbi:zinc-finger-containing protein [Cylindrospermum sp. FACHB-282]|uniref:zinc-finger-containing protein n=1 Tax=Cylindrospermum sp. FACHB-282 TaxID=2692794 RepID=UPI0016894592|nr:zinc-finger-containing protein [Cylindrospermum sp. FACHB-282]MBD2386012.1 hypothetical protein [Cylindrospermum sp. FACHB-282]